MLTKRILALIALFCLLPGIFALATEVECDSVYCFSGEEFGQALTGVCIIGLPNADTGTVLLGLVTMYLSGETALTVSAGKKKK